MNLKETYTALNILNTKKLTDREKLEFNRLIYSLLPYNALIDTLIDVDNSVLMYKAFLNDTLKK